VTVSPRSGPGGRRRNSSRAGSRKAVALLAAALLGTTLLAACSSEAEPEPKPSTTQPTSAPGPKVITFSVYGAPPVVAAYTRIAADFTAEHPDIVVNVRPYDSPEQAREGIIAGETPDVFLAERGNLPRLAENDRLEPVDSLLVDQGVDFGDGYQREALEAFSGENSLMCMPVDTSPLVVYYNRKKLDLATLTEEGERPISPKTGWTMEQFAEAARVASKGRTRGIYVAPTLEQIAPFVWSGGGQVVDDLREPTTLTLSDGDSATALEQLLELVRDPSATWNQQQIERVSAVNRFKTGRLAMILGYRELTPSLRQNPNLDFDVMPLPRLGTRATTGTMHGLCIGKDSEHEEAAAQFIAYAVGDEPTALLASTGYVVPTNLDVANSEAFQQLDQKPLSSDVFTRATRYIRQLPVGEGWEQVKPLAHRMLTRLFYDPVIDPFEERLQRIDDRSAQVFEQFAPPEETESPSPSPSPSESPSESPSD
jgi:multiple sugar transport system substrate-binding protein